MNLDAGTISPLEHGEVFTLDDGTEVDLDLGNYERYLGVRLTNRHNITTGKIYQQVIDRERRGDYLGKTVQIVPHLTNEIQDWIQEVAAVPVGFLGEVPDVCIVELGGTVGDIESAPFIEALRQFQFRVGKDNFILIHVSLVPVIHGEQKTKPTQAAIKVLRSVGLSPDFIACRCQQELEISAIEKISMFCHVGLDQVWAVHDVNSTYHVPLLMKDQKFIKLFTSKLKLNEIEISQFRIDKGKDLWSRWLKLTASHDRSFELVTIALVGKYTQVQDSYISVVKALEHAAMKCHKKLSIVWVESTDLESESNDKVKYHTAWSSLCSADGILVPGGFGSRGIEGMISAAKWAREMNVPFLGICLGFQIAVIEYARNVLHLDEANSVELDENTTDPVIVYMPEVSKTHMGGTMRLGLRPVKFENTKYPWSKLYALYSQSAMIHERHRHRYEVNPKYIKRLEESGCSFVARNADASDERMEALEIQDHPFYVGTQYHPEYLTRVLDPARPILGLVSAAGGVYQETLNGLVEGTSETDF